MYIKYIYCLEFPMKSYRLYDAFEDLPAHKIVAEISTGALSHNFSTLRSLVPHSEPICVVKADAYGHVADICVRVLLSCGCRFFAVSCIEEAISVRKICDGEGAKANILILGYTAPSLASSLAEYDLTQTLLSLEYAKELSAAAILSGVSVRAHVAVDTGMNRIGVCANTQAECISAADEIVEISRLGGIILEGAFTHFARSDEELSVTLSDDSHTRLQGERFIRVKRLVEERGLKLFYHACNSAATVRFPEFAFDGVRFGIMLYGIYPSRYLGGLGLMPVMKLKTLISHIHSVPVGESVSYGGIYKAQSETYVATLPIGYADGFLRSYSGAPVTVRTANGDLKARVIGRVCMDQCMIDVTGLDVSVGDEVILFGEDPSDLRRLATLADTIEYECLCLISARVPRIKK